jgi:leucine-zipper-like transcriptional regulator 1
MSNQPTSQNPDELCVLNDVRFFNLATRHWIPESQTSLANPNDPAVPRSRYAHLSSISADRLFIIGGQDFYNTWLDDVCVYDLKQRQWTQRTAYPRHCGTYRSVAVSSNFVVRTDENEPPRSSASIGAPGARFRDAKAPPSSPNREFTKSESLVHMPYSAAPTDAMPADIYLYSNYNVRVSMLALA